MKLISMKDFVLEQNEKIVFGDTEFKTKIVNYANFLNQPLTLGMFVACDLEGSVIHFDWSEIGYLDADHSVLDTDGHEGYEAYQQAKERVLFENFELDEYGNLFYGLDGLISNWKDKPIEQLLHKDLDITLTPTAQKQIGL